MIDCSRKRLAGARFPARHPGTVCQQCCSAATGRGQAGQARTTRTWPGHICSKADPQAVLHTVCPQAGGTAGAHRPHSPKRMVPVAERTSEPPKPLNPDTHDTCMYISYCTASQGRLTAPPPRQHHHHQHHIPCRMPTGTSCVHMYTTIIHVCAHAHRTQCMAGMAACVKPGRMHARALCWLQPAGQPARSHTRTSDHMCGRMPAARWAPRLARVAFVRLADALPSYHCTPLLHRARRAVGRPSPSIASAIAWSARHIQLVLPPRLSGLGWARRSRGRGAEAPQRSWCRIAPTGHAQ